MYVSLRLIKKLSASDSCKESFVREKREKEKKIALINNFSLSILNMMGGRDGGMSERKRERKKSFISSYYKMLWEENYYEFFLVLSAAIGASE